MPALQLLLDFLADLVVPAPVAPAAAPPRAASPRRGRAGTTPPARDGAIAADGTTLEARLRRLGLPAAMRVRTHTNRTVMVSVTRAGVLRVQAGYQHAPDEVLRAIVRFAHPRARRADRVAARRALLAFPIATVAHVPARRRSDAARPGDEALLDRLRAMHAELDQLHFGGRLGPIPIRLSGRMRRRLGELVADRATGAPVEIGISRRHLRRDGWAAVRETLLHEMVHQWQAQEALPLDHGVHFRRKALEVGIDPRATIQPGCSYSRSATS